MQPLKELDYVAIVKVEQEPRVDVCVISRPSSTNDSASIDERLLDSQFLVVLEPCAHMSVVFLEQHEKDKTHLTAAQ